MTRIDLNLDAGEIPEMIENGIEAQLYDLVSSVNIACGGHAGDESSMRSSVKLAKARGLAIGAHPSYPDRKNFGRTRLMISPADLINSLTQQMNALKSIASDEGVTLSHVKPHGALYNAVADDKAEAMAVIEAVRGIDRNLPIVGLAGSMFENWVHDEGMIFIAEAFVDRRYDANGRLKKRTEPDALIDDPIAAGAQALNLVCDQRVALSTRKWLSINARTLCIHGDTANALDNARVVHAILEKSGVEIKPVQFKG